MLFVLRRGFQLLVNEVAKGTPRVKSFSVGYEEEKIPSFPTRRRSARRSGSPASPIG